MSNFITNWHFFKNTYSEPFIVRVQFTVKIPAKCSLVADNMCRCDYWFSKEGNVKIKYNIIENDNANRSDEEVIEKSILVDLNAPYTPLSKLELIVTDGNGRSDCFSRLVTDIPDDPLARKVNQ